MNIALLIEYDGTDFHGWQRQPDYPSIQASIEDILSRLLGTRTIVYGASRTDSGVHAKAQMANFFVTTSSFDPTRWRAILNFYLPRSIRILRSQVVDDSFHSQKLAIAKTYDYRILNRPYESALDRRMLFYPKPLAWDRIYRALPYFEGEKDFRSFQGAKAEVQTTIRTIHSFKLMEEPDRVFRFRIVGSGFLKQMIRTMIGTLLEIGEWKRAPEDIPHILGSRDRNTAGRTIPAHGLCLTEVHLPKPFEEYAL